MHSSAPQTQRVVSGMDQPGVFQCLVLRACNLQKADRDVFLLKEIKGRSLAEIAAILGISSDDASKRLRRARREVGPVGGSAVEASETTTLAQVFKPAWLVRNRFFHPTGLRAPASLTSATDETDETTLAGRSRDTMLEIVEVAQWVVPTVIAAALSILR